MAARVIIPTLAQVLAAGNDGGNLNIVNLGALDTCGGNILTGGGGLDTTRPGALGSGGSIRTDGGALDTGGGNVEGVYHVYASDGASLAGEEAATKAYVDAAIAAALGQ